MGDRGFTLLELLVSLALLSVLVLTQVAPFRQTLLSRDRAEAALERRSAVRLVLQRLAEELEAAVPLGGEGDGFALSRQGAPASELRFATTGARRVHAGAADPIQRVRYVVEPGPPGEDSGRLVEEQLPSVAEPGTPATRIALLDGVLLFRVRIVPPGGTEWVEDWAPAPGEDAAALPRAVEVEISVADGSEVPRRYRLAVTLPLGGEP